MAKNKAKPLELKDETLLKGENSNLIKKLGSKIKSIAHLGNAYNLIQNIPERAYQYKVTSLNDVLDSVQGKLISPDIKFKLIEQALYVGLDYREKVPAGKLTEYDALLEKLAVEANLIQPKIPEERMIRYHKRKGERKWFSNRI